MIVYLQLLTSAFPLRDDRKCDFLYIGKDYVFLDDDGADLFAQFVSVRDGYSGRCRVLGADIRCSLWLNSDNLTYGGFVLASHVYNYHVDGSLLIGGYFIVSLDINARRQCLLVVDSRDEGFIGSICDDIVNSSPEMAQLILGMPEILWG